MMSESTLLEDRLERKMERLSIKLPISKDSSPKRELEERSSTRDQELTPGNKTKRLTSNTRNSSPNILRTKAAKKAAEPTPEPKAAPAKAAPAKAAKAAPAKAAAKAAPAK